MGLEPQHGYGEREGLGSARDRDEDRGATEASILHEPVHDGSGLLRERQALVRFRAGRS